MSRFNRRQAVQAASALLVSGLMSKQAEAAPEPTYSTAVGAACLAMSSEGALFAVPIKGNGVALFDYSTSKFVRLLTIPETVKIESLALTGPDRRIGALKLGAAVPMLAAGGSDGIVRLWNPLTGESVGSFSAHEKAVTGLVFSPDGTWMATISSSETRLHLWNVARRERINAVPGLAVSMDSLALSPDGKLLAIGGVSSMPVVHLYSVADPSLTKRFSGVLRGTHNLSVHALDFSPDGKRLVSGSMDKTACLWDIETRKLIQTFAKHAEPILAVGFHPSGKLVASAGLDTTLRLWNPETGEEVGRPLTTAGEVYAVKFAPDGKSLVRVGQRGVVRTDLSSA